MLSVEITQDGTGGVAAGDGMMDGLRLLLQELNLSQLYYYCFQLFSVNDV